MRMLIGRQAWGVGFRECCWGEVGRSRRGCSEEGGGKSVAIGDAGGWVEVQVAIGVRVGVGVRIRVRSRV